MLPSKLKNINLFVNGQTYVGQVAEVTLPKLTRKLEGYRGGGMDGEAQIDLGQEAMDMEWKLGGLVQAVFNGYADPSLSGQQIRFLGAYQSDDDGAVTAVEVVVRGRHQEIDMGNAKPGENTEHTIKTIPTYYKLTINGRVAIEIDILNMILMVNGVDRNAQLRAALGL